MNFFLGIAFLISGFLSAQELDTVAIDTTHIVAIDTIEVAPPYYLGAYVDGGIGYEASYSGGNALGKIGVGAQYNRWMLGFNYSNFSKNSETFKVVFPHTFTLLYRYGGMNVAYQFHQKKWISLIIWGGYFKGDMVWKNTADGQHFLRDEFELIKLGLKVEMNKIRYIKPYLSVGYQKMRKLDLSQVNENDFSGLHIVLGIRMGYFNQ